MRWFFTRFVRPLRSSSAARAAAAALKLGRTGGGLGTILAVIGIVYSIAMFFGAGWKATSWGLALALAGLPIRWASRRLWPDRTTRAVSAAA